MAEVYRTEILLPKCSIGIEDPDAKKVAERVDHIVSSLSDQLKSFEASAALTVGGVPASSIVSGSNAMYYQTFESDVHKVWNLRAGSISAITYPNNGQAGGRALRTTNKAVWLASDVNIPFDPGRLYRIRTRIRKISGTSRTAYVGVEGIGADRETVVDRNGSTGTTTTQNLVCLASTISSTSWAQYQGYFKGVLSTGTGSTPSTDASLPRYLHQNTKYIRPFFALSHGGDNGVYEIDYITLEILTETSEVNKILTAVAGRAASTIAGTIGSTGVITDNKVAGGSIATGAVGGGGDGGKDHMRSGSIEAGHIKVGTITADRMGVSQLSAIAASLGTISAGTLNNLGTLPTVGIRLDASSTRPASWVSYIDMAPPTNAHYIFKFPGLTITRGGNATFSGTVSVASLSAINANLGTIYAGTLNNLNTLPTVGIRLDASSTKPASWVSYIDMAPPTNADYIFKFPGLTITRGGNATFSGTVSVASLSVISSNLGSVNTGLINNAATSPTRGIRLDSGSSRPGTWTHYIDLAASGTNPVFKMPTLEIRADGSADFSGEVKSSNFTAVNPGFTGFITVSKHSSSPNSTGRYYADHIDFNNTSNGHRLIVTRRPPYFYGFGIELYKNGSTNPAHFQIQTDGGTIYLSDYGGAGTAVVDVSGVINCSGKVHAKSHIEIDGDLDHDGSKVGFFAATPKSQSDGWGEFTNSATRKTGAANTLTTEQLAQIVDTLIRELVALGLLSEIM